MGCSTFRCELTPWWSYLAVSKRTQNRELALHGQNSQKSWFLKVARTQMWCWIINYFILVRIRFSGLGTVCWVVLCRARPLIRGTGTTGEARETGAPLIVGGGVAAEERGLAKNNASPRRAKIHTCTYTHTGMRAVWQEFGAYIQKRCSGF